MLAMLLLDPWQADSYKRNQSVMRSTPPTQTDQHSALFTRVHFAVESIVHFSVFFYTLHFTLHCAKDKKPASCLRFAFPQICTVAYYSLSDVQQYCIAYNYTAKPSCECYAVQCRY